jgi:hypothetical protein
MDSRQSPIGFIGRYRQNQAALHIHYTTENVRHERRELCAIAYEAGAAGQRESVNDEAAGSCEDPVATNYVKDCAARSAVLVDVFEFGQDPERVDSLVKARIETAVRLQTIDLCRRSVGDPAESPEFINLTSKAFSIGEREHRSTLEDREVYGSSEHEMLSRMLDVDPGENRHFVRFWVVLGFNIAFVECEAAEEQRCDYEVFLGPRR